MISYLTNVVANLMVAVISASLEENELTPTKVVSSVFEEIKSLKEEKINIDLINEEYEENIKLYEASKEILKKAENIEYKINSEIINENNGIVSVTVKGINLDDLISQFYNQLLLDGVIYDEQYSEYDKVLSNIVDKVQYSESTGDIELIKNSDKWMIKDKNDITNLVFFM